ncbi:hypothetical protein NH287_07285 [Microbacterium sp. CnD16-F]|uniref:hypothetical protein n=1 Tax=Microbacterium sp. CnD16-F TaxID=2954493 RepID=UPI000EC5D7A7|nr:hypothetical protein [Microbacterium sp. CnD16-F]MCO7203293.1 hypothetical protein [Microbacterium sp. CnD16-F]HCJ48293.1 hypothetical protein [Microbacterium sp.]
MVFHSKQTLEHWVAEFIDARNAGEDIRVAVQDGSGGEDTGLVLIPLTSAPNSVWIEPRESGDDLSWHVFIEPAGETLDLTSFELNALTHELQIAAELCAYLQERSLGHYEPEPTPKSSSSTAE